MKNAEGWGFVLLTISLMGTTLSMTLLDGAWQLLGLSASVLSGILSGGAYAVAGGQTRQEAEARPSSPSSPSSPT